MAGGEGSRFAPYSKLLEKSMLPLAGKPIVRIIVERLLKSLEIPASDITICILMKHKDHFYHEFRDIEGIQFSIEETPKGTASDYFMAAYMRGIEDNEVSLVHYADCFTDIDYNGMLVKYYNAKHDALIAITQNVRHDYSEVQVKVEVPVSRVSTIIEKPLLRMPTWTGIAIFRHRAIKEIIGGYTEATRQRFDFGYDILPALVEKGEVVPYLNSSAWYDVGNVNQYQRLRELVENGDIEL